MAMTKREMIKAILESYKDSGKDPNDDGIPIKELDLDDLVEVFKEEVGYDPEDMAEGGEVKKKPNRMKKPVKKANGGMMNKGTKVRGQGAAIRGTKFKGVF